jgi:hypothetical protein
LVGGVGFFFVLTAGAVFKYFFGFLSDGFFYEFPKLCIVNYAL